MLVLLFFYRNSCIVFYILCCEICKIISLYVCIHRFILITFKAVLCSNCTQPSYTTVPRHTQPLSPSCCVTSSTASATPAAAASASSSHWRCLASTASTSSPCWLLLLACSQLCSRTTFRTEVCISGIY